MRHVFAFLLACASCLLFLDATAAGFPTPSGTISNFIDFTPSGTQPGLSHGIQGSGNCGGCHTNGPEPHLPYTGWSGSMMANATRDPLFWAALDVANKDGEALGIEGIGDFCLRCHTPKAWLEGRVRKVRDVNPVDGEVDADGVVEGFRGCLLEGTPDAFDGNDNDFGGVGCHYCHRVKSSGPLGQPAIIGNADAFIDDSSCNGSGEPCRAGPYRYPYDVPAEIPGGGWIYSNPPHAWKHSPFHSDSALCGSCHDVTSPPAAAGAFRNLIDPSGNDTGLAFPIERTYSEWLASDYAIALFSDGAEDGGDVSTPGVRVTNTTHCQDCHMRQAQPAPGEPGGLLVCNSGPPRDGDLPTHEFVGGNTWIPAILKGEYPLLNRGEAFDRTIAWAIEMLGERTAKVQATAQVSAGTGTVSVKVTNLAGHKLPTGYGEGRRMWLHVAVRDANNTLVFESGGYDAATGELAMNPPPKIYEIKQGIWDSASGACKTQDSDGKEIFHFVLNNCVAKDNRIPPLGFVGASNPEIKSYGYSYPPMPGSPAKTANFDVADYSFPVAGAVFPLTVQATLRYQIASKEYVEFLRDQAVEHAIPAENDLCAGGPNRPFTVGPQNRSRGQYMYEMWENYGRSAPVAAGSASVQIAGP